MKLSDRIKRWLNPAEWRDEHPETSDGEGYALSEEQRRAGGVADPGPFHTPGSDQRGGRDVPRD
jgi:hypothetical protein